MAHDCIALRRMDNLNSINHQLTMEGVKKVIPCMLQHRVASPSLHDIVLSLTSYNGDVMRFIGLQLQLVTLFSKMWSSVMAYSITDRSHSRATSLRLSND